MIKCIVIEDEKLASDFITNHVEMISDLELLGVFENALAALPIIFSGQVDIVYCDIHLPDVDGVSLLKSMNNPPLFIFITRDPKHAVESFELGVVDYIIKPFDTYRFVKSVNRARAFLKSDIVPTNDRNFLVIKDRHANVIVPYDEVFFIKSDKDFVHISTTEKLYTVWKKISDMEVALCNARQFLRIHKSYIVNIDFAKTIEGNHIKMKGSIDNIPIGGQYKSILYKHLGI